MVSGCLPRGEIRSRFILHLIGEWPGGASALGTVGAGQSPPSLMRLPSMASHYPWTATRRHVKALPHITRPLWLPPERHSISVHARCHAWSG
jgi:hypothetical protein